MQAQQRQALETRAERALRNLYHAATPSYPGDFGPYADAFDSWLSQAGSDEIDYLSDGGPYGANYSRTLYANASRQWGLMSPAGSAKARAYVRRHLAERARDVAARPYLDTVETFGRLYSWGRGGRTVAPKGLVSQRGGSSFSLDASSFAEMNAADLTQAVRVLESFVDYVKAWNRGVPQMWADYTAERAGEERAGARADLDEARKEARAILADVRKVRGAKLETPAICDALRARLAVLRREVTDARATLARLADVAPAGWTHAG
jgi:hypothetical protein